MTSGFFLEMKSKADQRKSKEIKENQRKSKGIEGNQTGFGFLWMTRLE